MPGNRANFRHGLKAGSAAAVRARDRRLNQLVRLAFKTLPGLDANDEAVVRSWARAEIRATDCWARLQVTPDNQTLNDHWVSAERLAGDRRRELFMTPASRLAAAKLTQDWRNEVAAAGALESLQHDYAPQPRRIEVAE